MPTQEEDEDFNIFKHDLIKVAITSNQLDVFAPVFSEIDLVYVLSSGEPFSKKTIDGRVKIFYPIEDYHRIRFAVAIAKAASPHEDPDVPVYYNGRILDNEDLREILELVFRYPKESFIIEEINPTNTIEHAKTLQRFLSKYPYFSNIAVVSNACKLPRIARAFGKDSPTISSHDKQGKNPIEHANFILFGINASFSEQDLADEIKAMQMSSSGPDPSIARDQPLNTFLNPTDVLFQYSFGLQNKQKLLNREPAPLEPEEETEHALEPKRQRASV